MSNIRNNNYSPECTDVLSAEITKTYIQLLDNLAPSDDISNMIRLVPGFSRMGDLIAFTQKKAQYTLDLFELTARSRRLNAARCSMKEHDVKKLIDATYGLISHKKRQNKQTSDAFAENYKTLFGNLPSRGDALKLSISSIVQQYNIAIQAYLPGLLEGSLILHNIHAVIQNAAIDLFVLRDDIDLKSLIADEHRLIASNNNSREAVNGLAQAIMLSYSKDNASDFLGRFLDFTNSLKVQLTGYLTGRRIHAEKRSLVVNLLNAINSIPDAVPEQGFIGAYIANMLTQLIRVNALHQTIVLNHDITYGKLGVIFSDALPTLLELTKDYDFSCDPYFVSQYPDYSHLGIDAKTFQYPCIAASATGDLSLVVKEVYVAPKIHHEDIAKEAVGFRASF